MEIVTKTAETGAAKKSRRHYSGAEKLAALRRHLLEKVPVSTICDQMGIQVTLFYLWQRILFERGATVFETGNTAAFKRAEEAMKKRIEQLEAKLVLKNEVVAELLQEHVQLKKVLGGL